MKASIRTLQKFLGLSVIRLAQKINNFTVAKSFSRLKRGRTITDVLIEHDTYYLIIINKRNLSKNLTNFYRVPNIYFYDSYRQKKFV